MRRLYYEGDIVEWGGDKWIVSWVPDTEDWDGYDIFTFSINPYPECGGPTETFTYSFHRTEKVPTELGEFPIISPSIERLFR